VTPYGRATGDIDPSGPQQRHLPLQRNIMARRRAPLQYLLRGSTPVLTCGRCFGIARNASLHESVRLAA
jgi:hypothetical protein